MPRRGGGGEDLVEGEYGEAVDGDGVEAASGYIDFLAVILCALHLSCFHSGDGRKVFRNERGIVKGQVCYLCKTAWVMRSLHFSEVG